MPQNHLICSLSAGRSSGNCKRWLFLCCQRTSLNRSSEVWRARCNLASEKDMIDRKGSRSSFRAMVFIKGMNCEDHDRWANGFRSYMQKHFRQGFRRLVRWFDRVSSCFSQFPSLFAWNATINSFDDQYFCFFLIYFPPHVVAFVRSISFHTLALMVQYKKDENDCLVECDIFGLN